MFKLSFYKNIIFYLNGKGPTGSGTLQTEIGWKGQIYCYNN